MGGLSEVALVHRGRAGRSSGGAEAAEESAGDEVGGLRGIHIGELVGGSVDESVEDRPRPGCVGAGAQVALVDGAADEGVESGALFLATDAGLGVLLHHAARVDRPLTADGDDPFQVAVEGDRNRGLGEACLVQDLFGGVEFGLEDGTEQRLAAGEAAVDGGAVYSRGGGDRRHRGAWVLGQQLGSGLEHSGEVACGVSSHDLEILRPADTFGTNLNLLVATHMETATFMLQ
jgi:hypothetical protein